MRSQSSLLLLAMMISFDFACSRSLHDQFKMARWAQQSADDRMVMKQDIHKIEHAERALDRVNTIGSIKGRAILARQKGYYRVDEHGVPHSVLPFTGEVHELFGNGYWTEIECEKGKESCTTNDCTESVESHSSEATLSWDTVV